MAMQAELMALKKWMKKQGNSAAYIAAKLGYKSSFTITTWIARGKIPMHACKPLMDLIEKGDASL